jgi:hypothetical protein
MAKRRTSEICGVIHVASRKYNVCAGQQSHFRRCGKRFSTMSWLVPVILTETNMLMTLRISEGKSKQLSACMNVIGGYTDQLHFAVQS